MIDISGGASMTIIYRSRIFAPAGLLLIALLLVTGVAAAQDDTGDFELVDTELDAFFTIYAPPDWEVEAGEDDDAGTFTLSGDGITVTVYAPEVVSDMAGTEKDGEPVAVLLALYEALRDEAADEADVEESEFDGRAAAFIDYASGLDEGRLATIAFDDETVGALDVAGSTLVFDDAMPLIDAMLASFDVVDSPPDAESMAAAEPCLISVETARTARLRVGPGLNRTSVAFLEPGTDFAALGRFTDDDGNVWYQLDPEIAAPGRSMAEAWVLSDEVDAAGDCDAVVDAAAPPIIPITDAGPPPPAGDDSGDESGEAAPTASAGDITPLSGNWTMALNGTTLLSCAGTETLRLNTIEFFGTTALSGRLTAAAGGGSFTFLGDTFTRRTGNRFSGSFTFDPTSNAQIRFDATSPSAMTGEIVVNVVVDGTGCSTTTYLAMSRG
jgi:hypothetical protein